MANTFPKSERLRSRILIDELFSKGKELKRFPFLVRFLLLNTETPGVSIVISVPKRRAKRAVDRNRLRRQIREAYRLNKTSLIEKMKSEQKSLALFLIYTGKEKEEYHFLKDKLKLLLEDLKQKA